MQIKTVLRFHLTPVRTAKISNTSGTSRMWSTRNTPPLLVGVQTYTATMEISVAVPQNGTLSTSRPRYITLGHIPKGHFILHPGHLFNYVNCYSVHNSKKQPRCPSKEE